MRRHFVFHATSYVPSPTGQGSTEEWLEFYKLQRDDEVYVRFTYVGIPPVPGDILWFQLDERVLAFVDILHVQEDTFNGGLEFWYSGSRIERVYGVRSPPVSGALTHILGEQWMHSTAMEKRARPLHV